MEFKIEIQADIGEKIRLQKEWEFQEFLNDSIAGRVPMPGMAIDNPKTISPEDAFTVTEYDDGSFYVAVSFPEVGILDPEGKTIKRIISDLSVNPNKTPGCNIPKKRNMMTYDTKREIPSLTVQGIYKPGGKITHKNIIRSRVNPSLYTYEDEEELSRLEHYFTAQRFAFLFAKHHSRINFPGELRTASFSDQRVSPADVTEQFMIFANSVVGKLSRTANLPQMYRIHSPHKHQRPFYRSRPGFHEGVNSHAYCGMTNPLRELRSWIAHVSLTHYMDNGESPVEREDIQLIADWLNTQKRACLSPEGLILAEALEPNTT